MIDYNEELTFLKNYIHEISVGFYYQYIYWRHLLALWTAFCLHQNPDNQNALLHTLYDDIASELDSADKSIKDTFFSTFEQFKKFMLQDNKLRTNEDWLCQLDTEGKAREISDITASGYWSPKLMENGYVNH